MKIGKLHIIWNPRASDPRTDIARQDAAISKMLAEAETVSAKLRAEFERPHRGK